MLNRIFVVASTTLTSTGSAVSSFLPFDTSCMKLPTQIVVKATGQGAYVRLSDNNSAATNADLLVQGGDHVVLSVAGRRYVSVLSDGASSTVSVGALSTGVWGSALGIQNMLFGGGEAGAWYDPSDLTTLFQDSAGTTPVTAVEQSVGLMLDKSKGGRQALPITGWVKSSGDGVVTINGGTITVTGATTTTRIDINVPGWAIGNYAEITINGTVGAAIGAAVYVGGANFYAITSGSKTYQNILASSALCRVQLDSGSATFDVTSRAYVPGNHAYQSTSTSRPVLRARYNLLTYSEQFDNAAYRKNGLSVSPNVATAPDGTTTADLLTGSGTGAQDFDVYPADYGNSGGAIQTFSIYVKQPTSNAAPTIQIDLATTGSVLNLSTGAITNASGGGPTGGASAVQVGNGWWRFAVTTVKTNVFHYWAVRLPSASSQAVLLWGAQLIVTNSLTSNAYQRIADAATYDTSGFLPYLAFDGTDDSLLTNSVDFSATDKMTVWAGVRKLSDAAQGVVSELSATIALNNGSFLLTAPNSAAANYNWSSKGTTQVDNTVTTYTAPITNVVTGIADIAGASNIIRTNGAQVGSVATTQGTGNYGNYPLYIGRRNNATLPFNGNLYSLIIRGAQSTASQISATENWVEIKTFGKDMQYVYSDPVLTASLDQVTTANGEDVFMTVTYQ